MDPHLVEDTIFTSQATPHPTQILTQTLDTSTVHHLATVMVATSPNHSWQEVTFFNLMKLKESFIRIDKFSKYSHSN